ncbi:MAG: hypothetical protein JNJ77_16990 [Planctomycetia bacterium]|nr:hypothetical protein [Planctomycetia bacterium]
MPAEARFGLVIAIALIVTVAIFFRPVENTGFTNAVPTSSDKEPRIVQGQTTSFAK